MKNLKNSQIVKNSKSLLNDNDLLELDLSNLDSQNFENLILKMQEKAKKEKLVKNKKGRSSIYKIDTDTKIRRNIRKERNFLLNEILINSNNQKELKKSIDNFDKFYKDTYILNDYSLNSICSENSDINSKSFCKISLEIVKRFKSKK